MALEILASLRGRHENGQRPVQSAVPFPGGRGMGLDDVMGVMERCSLQGLVIPGHLANLALAVRRNAGPTDLPDRNIPDSFLQLVKGVERTEDGYLVRDGRFHVGFDGAINWVCGNGRRRPVVLAIGGTDGGSELPMASGRTVRVDRTGMAVVRTVLYLTGLDEAAIVDQLAALKEPMQSRHHAVLSGSGGHDHAVLDSFLGGLVQVRSVDDGYTAMCGRFHVGFDGIASRTDPTGLRHHLPLIADVDGRGGVLPVRSGTVESVGLRAMVIAAKVCYLSMPNVDDRAFMGMLPADLRFILRERQAAVGPGKFFTA